MPGGKQGWSGAVYLSARLKHALSNSRRIDMDVTFKVLPVQLGTRLQLLTVHAEYLNYKNAAGVRGVLQYLMQLVQQWQPEIVLADFETAIRNAARLVWPHARIVGCFFHYAQAIFPHAFHSATVALDSLQSQGWQGIVHAHSAMPSSCRQDPDWATYMENTWMRMIGPETFSVFSQCHRTNNALEGFYNRLLQRMGPHPGVWQFHESGRLVQGTYNEAQFLDIMSNSTRGLQQRWGVVVPHAGCTNYTSPTY
ncbi:uncharacterized protein LOC124372139 [Homalodisca vitripennis]|uniref:uncharacterized protein LOC124372139 n=1 Tax=Homalodisca vitripennis TaxID=197043 RepID=UPI001EEC9B92|nr:uncharacterized protein LOC124372139 [Homalodisca vitripennis]